MDCMGTHIIQNFKCFISTVVAVTVVAAAAAAVVDSRVADSVFLRFPLFSFCSTCTYCQQKHSSHIFAQLLSRLSDGDEFRGSSKKSNQKVLCVCEVAASPNSLWYTGVLHCRWECSYEGLRCKPP